jgi:hypothetical protein
MPERNNSRSHFWAHEIQKRETFRSICDTIGVHIKSLSIVTSNIPLLKEVRGFVHQDVQTTDCARIWTIFPYFDPRWQEFLQWVWKIEPSIEHQELGDKVDDNIGRNVTKPDDHQQVGQIWDQELLRWEVRGGDTYLRDSRSYYCLEVLMVAVSRCTVVVEIEIRAFLGRV